MRKIQTIELPVLPLRGLMLFPNWRPWNRA